MTVLSAFFSGKIGTGVDFFCPVFFFGGFIGVHTMLDKLCIDIARAEVGIFENFFMQGNGGLRHQCEIPLGLVP